jgi:potassium-transporting ATPase KdpC subunit
MFSIFITQLKIALKLLIAFIVLTGIIYPLIVTVFAHGLFSWRANGSMIAENGKFIGSKLIGQSFTEDKYFWGRPSATKRFPYDAENSTGSNLSQTNPDFIKAVKQRVERLKQSPPQQNTLILVALVTASASGIDPDISVDAAVYQIARVAQARHVAEKKIRYIVMNHIQKRRLCSCIG